MNVKFSKDELAMVYQYAAATKQETLAGLREIVPVIRDRQAREIVESTIRKLDAIPEPECRRFIADTRQRFIQKRDNSIRRRLAEAKAQTREKTPHSKRKRARPGTVIIASRAVSVASPSERGRNYTPVEPVRCVLPEAPCRERMISTDFQSVPIITGDVTLPLRWPRQLPLCGLAARKHLALQAVPVQQVLSVELSLSTVI